MILVLAMKCCTKMPCPLPHNHYCCFLSSPICLPHLLICTCLISSPIACLPSDHLCYVDVYCVVLYLYVFIGNSFIICLWHLHQLGNI